LSLRPESDERLLALTGNNPSNSLWLTAFRTAPFIHRSHPRRRAALQEHEAHSAFRSWLAQFTSVRASHEAFADELTANL
jgi:hypothetical protein